MGTVTKFHRDRKEHRHALVNLLRDCIKQVNQGRVHGVALVTLRKAEVETSCFWDDGDVVDRLRMLGGIDRMRWRIHKTQDAWQED